MSKNGGVVEKQDPPAIAEQFYTAVQTATKAGNQKEVQSLLQQWQSDASIPNPTPQELNYLVPRAAKDNGQPAILEYLLSQGGEIGTYTTGQTTSPEIFQIFIDHGWEVDNSILVSHISHPDLVSLIHSHGADPKIPNARGFYPLDTAALRAQLESVKLLLSHGAPLGPESRAMNAAAQGDVPDRTPVMACLLENGADINALAVDYPAPFEAQRSGRKGTPLHAAAKWGNEEARVWLLEHGADAEARNEVGETAEEWGKRFEKDGSERVLRIRRAINRKNQAKKTEEREEKMQKNDAEAL